MPIPRHGLYKDEDCNHVKRKDEKKASPQICAPPSGAEHLDNNSEDDNGIDNSIRPPLVETKKLGQSNRDDDQAKHYDPLNN